MIRKILLTIVFTQLLWGCATYPQCEKRTEKGKGRPPVLVDYYAAKVIRPGRTWKLYLRAEDKDGDMNNIVVMLSQTGVGTYPTAFTRLNGDDSQTVAGYLFLNTPPDQALVWDTLSFEVFVRDCEGNRSNRVKFQLGFNYKPPPQSLPEKWQAVADRSLGAIMLRIISSDRFNRDSRGILDPWH
jgi:hypothetical protein